MGKLAAHHAGVGLHRHHRQTTALENTEVCFVMRLVLLCQPVPICVQAVGIEHGEFPHADQPGARAGVIPPLGLKLVHQHGQLAVGLDFGARQAGDDFLVGHCQHHVAVGAVLEPAHLRADLVPATGFLPDIRRMNNRHGEFLPADGIHLLADDLHDLCHGTVGKRQVAENARTKRADVTGAQQQLVPGSFCIGRGFAQGLTKQAGKFHARPP